MKNTKNILISQNISNGEFSGIFGPNKLYDPITAKSWGRRSSHDEFINYMKKQWKEQKQIYSLACDEVLGFAFYFMGKYGDDQSLLTNTPYIKEEWDQGMQICPNSCSLFCRYIGNSYTCALM